MFVEWTVADIMSKFEVIVFANFCDPVARSDSTFFPSYIMTFNTIVIDKVALLFLRVTLLQIDKPSPLASRHLQIMCTQKG